MGGFEVAAIALALVIMSATIGARVVTTQLLNRMQRVIGEVNSMRQKTMGEYKLAQSRRKVAAQNRGMLRKKKAKLQKKIDRLREELASFRGEMEHRQQVRETMRGKLVRPPLAAPLADDSADTEASP